MSLYPFKSATATSLGFALLVCFTVVGHANADDKTVDEPTVSSQISEWIVQLDDDLYALRKKAQQELEHAGQSALDAVTQEASIGSLESSTRALNVLLSWTESKNHELQIAALEKLATLPNRPIEAGLAAELLADAREKAALAALAALGGRYGIDTQVRAVPLVANLPNLQIIIDSKWKGELDGLKHLAAVRRTTTISFHFAPVDDGVLEHLTGLPNVSRVEFYGTPISEETVKQLEEQLPNAEIIPTKGALLGIHGDGVRQGPVLIIKVNEGFAAAKAGLRKNDAITEIEGEKIKDFRDLTRQIGKYKPGETVELTILRDGNLIKKQVTFDRWGEQAGKKTNETQRNFPTRQRTPAPRKITLDRR